MSYKFLILTLVLVILSFPYKTLEVPEWKVTVLDENGLPMNNIEITQNYKNYTFEMNSGKQEKPMIMVWYSFQKLF